MRSALWGLMIAVLLAGCAGGSPGPSPAVAPGAAGVSGSAPAPATPGSAAPAAPPAASPAPAAPAASPVAPAPAPADLPRLARATVTMLERSPPGVRVLGQRPLIPGASEVPAEVFLVTFTLEPPPAAPWYREVRVEGAPIDPLRQELLRAGTLELRIHPGPAGSALTVTLPATRDSSQQTYRLTRAPLPAAEVQVEQGGVWVTPDPWQVYPESNLRVRFRFTAPMDQASVEASLSRWPSPATPRHPGMDGGRFTWESDSSLVAQWAKAPPVILWSLDGAATPGGLFVRGSAPPLHTGNPSGLVAIDPASGAERPLFAVAPQVFRAQYAAEPGRLLLYAWDLSSAIGAGANTRSYLYDVTTGPVTHLPGRQILIESTGEIRQQPDRLPSSSVVGPLSPDGSRQLFFTRAGDGPDAAGLVTGALELRSPSGELIRVLDPGVRAHVNRFTAAPDAAWSPDGRKILYTSRQDGLQADLIMRDLETEGSAPQRLTAIPAYPQAFTLQWRGGRAVAGPSVIDVASGSVTMTIKEPFFARWLSPDGRHLLGSTRGGNNSGDWGLLTLLDLETGMSRTLGEGLPAGWTAAGEALVLRWDGHPWRYRPTGL